MLNYKTSLTEIFSTMNIQNPYTLQDMSVCKQVYVHTDKFTSPRQLSLP